MHGRRIWPRDATHSYSVRATLSQDQDWHIAARRLGMTSVAAWIACAADFYAGHLQRQINRLNREDEKKRRKSE